MCVCVVYTRQSCEHCWVSHHLSCCHSWTVFLVSLQENLTEALADLDAALEKELSRDCEHDSAALQAEESTTKVEELEKQCKTLESELDSVKGL